MFSTLIFFWLVVFERNAIADEVPVSHKEGAEGAAVSEKAPAAQEEWNPPSGGPFTTWTAPLCGKGKLVIQPFFFFNQTRGEFDAKGHYNPLPKGDWEYQFQEQLAVHYGIIDRLEVDAQKVYQENYVKEGSAMVHVNGFGDSYLFLRGSFFEEKGCLPSITGLLQLKVPTGKYQHEDSEKLGVNSMGTGS
jgi:hypothetical protein